MNLTTTRVTQGKLGLPLPCNSLDLYQTQKQQDEILDSSRVLISLSNTRNENIKNPSTRWVRLTGVINSSIKAGWREDSLALQDFG